MVAAAAAVVACDCVFFFLFLFFVLSGPVFVVREEGEEGEVREEVEGKDDEDDVDDDDSANESWGGGSGNESDSGDVLERYQHLLDDKTLNGESADGGSSYEEFALSRSSLKKEKTFTLAKAKAKLYFRDHPSASPSAEYTEMLECDESRQLLDDAPHKGKGAFFEYIDDNFVFKTMKKASLWENGAPVSAILYRRRPREGSLLMESYLL